MKARRVFLGLLAVLPTLCQGANIDRSTITEVVKTVTVTDLATRKTAPARVQAEFFAPNVLRTGPDSRAEMVAPDQTVTRVGQNTVFSFARDSREVELQKGSILFQSPTGKGGGTVRTPAASAAVLGTTIIVTATRNGGFKVLLVEGHGKVRTDKGAVRDLNAGQMVYALPGGKLSSVFEFRLSEQVGASALVRSFKKKLPSAEKIQAAIDKQEKEIGSGKVVDTGLLASGSPSIAYRVDVARETIAKEKGGMTTVASGSRFQADAGTAATANMPQLDRTRIFVNEDPDGLEFPGDSRPVIFGEFADGNGFSRAANPAQYVGQDIHFNTSSVSLDAFADRDVFQFLALKDILFDGSVDFGKYNSPIQFWAGGTIGNSTSALVKADSPQLTFVAFGSSFDPSRELPASPLDIRVQTPLRLEGFSVDNRGALNLLGGDVMLTGTRLVAGTALNVASARDLLISGTPDGPLPPDTRTPFNSVPSQVALLGADGVANIAAGRDLLLAGASVQAPVVRVSAGRNLRLVAVQLNDGSTPDSPLANNVAATGGRSVALRTQDLLNLSKVNFLSNAVLMQARTIQLTNVNFRGGSRVILESQVGRLAQNPNTGQPVVPGFVNFIKGVQYGGTPAQNSVIQNGPSPSGTPSGPGIVIRPR